jgi:hypothetical protein
MEGGPPLIAGPLGIMLENEGFAPAYDGTKEEPFGAANLAVSANRLKLAT